MKPAALFTIFVASLFALCVAPPKADPDLFPTLPKGILALSVQDANGTPQPLALIVAKRLDGTPAWFAGADLQGHANVDVGAEAVTLEAFAADRPVRLLIEGKAWGEGGTHVSPVQFTQRIAMPNPTFPAQLGTTCTEKTDGDTGCGLDEPSVVVDARGWIYYTAACCFLVSSPVFVSKDNGATFQALTHTAKDAYGNEGDLAIDDEGNLYYMDIDLATFGIARWNPDLTPAYSYRRPGEPLVDRPWIRAGSGGVVHAIYNTGLDTVYYRSTDYAMTFEAVPSARLGSNLGGAYSDVRRGIVGMVGGGSYVESTDGGRNWGGSTPVKGCDDAGANDERASVDAAGTVWFQLGACVVGRLADGSWTEPVTITPEGMDVHFAWVAAGAPGGVAVGYYGRVSSEADAKASGLEPDAWYLFVAFSGDADDRSPHWANLLVDPQPLARGPMTRELGDFMNTAIGPDGSIHLAYARNPEMDDSATATYIGTHPIPLLAPPQPLVGPFAKA